MVSSEVGKLDFEIENVGEFSDEAPEHLLQNQGTMVKGMVLRPVYRKL